MLKNLLHEKLLAHSRLLSLSNELVRQIKLDASYKGEVLVR